MSAQLARLEAALKSSTPARDVPELLELTREAQQSWPMLEVAPAEWVRWLRARRAAAGDSRLDAPALYLVCGCLGADPAALRHFDDELRAAAQPVLRRLGLGAAAADEVLQAVRTHLLVADEKERRLASYSGRATLRDWLVTVCLRQAFDHRRRQRAMDSLGAIERRPDSVDPEHAVVKADQRAHLVTAIGDALAALTPRQRALLRLHVAERLSIDELAPMFGASRASLARWVEDAREALGAGTRHQLRARLQLDSASLESLIHSARQSIDLSLERLLAADEPEPPR